MNIELLGRLCETPGVPGREERIRELVEGEIDGLFDEVHTDPMGSLICSRKPTRKRRGEPTRVMVAAHMDEIGFYVSHIDDKGFLRVNPAGGFDMRNLFSRRVLVCTDDGSVGRKGFVTDFVHDLLRGGRLEPGDYVFTCGPVPMFRALQKILGDAGVDCEAATEEYMGCGFGVCFGCNLKQRQPDGSIEYKLCCVDGCLFPLDSLVFEDEPA